LPRALARPRSRLLQSLSAALASTSIMARLHDPDHVLADETARQFIEHLERAGITVTPNARPAPPQQRPATATPGHRRRLTWPSLAVRGWLSQDEANPRRTPPTPYKHA